MVRIKWPVVTIALIALTVAIGLVAPEPSPNFDLLVLDRAQPRHWAWLTTHFLHTDYSHLLWNLAAFVCLGWLAESQARARFVISLCVGIVAVDLWFVLFSDEFPRYCGLSGALNTVLLVTLYTMRGSIPSVWLYTFAAAVALKLAWELHAGDALFTHTRWPSAVTAHIAGYVAGVMLVTLFAWRDRPTLAQCAA